MILYTISWTRKKKSKAKKILLYDEVQRINLLIDQTYIKIDHSGTTKIYTIMYFLLQTNTHIATENERDGKRTKIHSSLNSYIGLNYTQTYCLNTTTTKKKKFMNTMLIFITIIVYTSNIHIHVCVRVCVVCMLY